MDLKEHYWAPIYTYITYVAHAAPAISKVSKVSAKIYINYFVT